MEMGMVETESMSRMMDSEKLVGSVTEALVELWNGFLECLASNIGCTIR